MDHETFTYTFPLWLRINHFVNFLFLTLLMRSGIQILMDHPKLYWNDHCLPGSEWARFTRKELPKDKLWTSMDEAENVNAFIALPGGHHNLGLGRHWHFLSAIFWIVNGVVFVVLLCLSGDWRTLIPTSPDIVPRALHTLTTYASFKLPPAGEFRPFDPLQQLAYAFVVFVMAPLTIMTGAAMSPALAAQYPWYTRIFGGRQVARSIHFILLVGYAAFLVVHVTLVILTGFRENMNKIVMGAAGYGNLGAMIGLLALGLVIALNIGATWWSKIAPRSVQDVTGLLTDSVMGLLFDKMVSRQHYRKEEISSYFRVNGHPPCTEEWLELEENDFKDYRLKIHGLVEKPIELSLNELKSLPKQQQISKHNCIQGWSAIAEWGGAPLSEIIKISRPLPNARYLIFHSFQFNDGVEYYGSLSLLDANHPQTILAYEMNFQPLPVNHGAPLRLRVETKVGFKMVKWIRSIEFVEDYRTVGLGHGGYREDYQFYGTKAEI